MKNIIIAKRYSQAALQVLNPEKYHDILNQIHILKVAFRENPQIIKILVSSIVKRNDKIRILNNLIENFENNDFWQRSFSVLIKKNRSDLIEQFLSEFEELLDKAMDQKRITLIFAHEPDDETVLVVKNAIEEILQSKIVYDIRVDKSIIGGFVAMNKNKLIDASVLSNLCRFVKHTYVR